MTSSVVQVRIVELPGGRVRYLEAGAGRPLVCLHAFPLSADEWRPLLLNPPPGYRVIAPDLRGFRGPDAGAVTPVSAGDRVLAGVTMDTYAQDVIDLLDHLGIDRAVVAGVSMGGYVAFALARLAPARLAGLVLVSTRATADSAEGRAGRDRMTDLVTREGLEALAREMLPKLLAEQTTREQPEVVSAVRRLILANTTAGVVAGLRALRDRPDARPGLPAIACPTVIIHGEADAIIARPESEAMHHAIAGSRLVVVPGGHLEGVGSVFHNLPQVGDRSRD